MKRTLPKTLLVVLAVFVLAAGLLYAVHRRYYGNTVFDRAAWVLAANDHTMNYPRQRMVKDLRLRYLRKGLTRKEVRAMLGKPDWDSFSKEVDSYFIGVWGFASADAITLDVHYDNSGIFTCSALIEH